MQGDDVTELCLTSASPACPVPVVGRTAAEFRSADMENLGLAVRMAHHHLLDMTQSVVCQADIAH